MTELLLIAVGAALVNNVVLARFLGLCPVLGTGRRLDTAAGMALATTAVLTLSAALAWLVDRQVLVPLDAEYLRITLFIVIIAGTVQLAGMIIRATSPILHRALGMYLPLITTNCAVLGVVLLNTAEASSLAGALAAGLGAGAGFSLVLVLFAGLNERLDQAEVPGPFRGAGVALVTAGILSLAFLGFAGLGRG